MYVAVWPDTGWSGSNVVAAVSNFLFGVMSHLRIGDWQKPCVAGVCLATQNLLICNQLYRVLPAGVRDLI